MDKFNNEEVKKIFDAYPDSVCSKMMFLRQLILDTAREIEGIKNIEETLKWGEPGYLTKSGSTIRMDWKKAKPNQYAIYFHCKTKLVDTFKEIYKDKLNFEGNRAIVFDINEKIPVNELKHCIALSLTYHSIKHLPMLGV
ncbi:hypothetical protein MNBD_GAMMA06-792 [hydrothermal vent metagenome]|uniref:YdhG-like domain-containing protein n=1 Tax=hydrothermal vent metagenome TaxID=652676 RepID=A0A3B0W917_9ZZZZ